VDAADMHLLMQPDFAESEDFFSGEIAYIKQDECTQCGKCAEVCRFDAIPVIDGKYMVDPLSCEGCGYCARICPVDAIINKPLNVGKWYVSNIKTGTTMVHARLGIGADNSGKLVTQVKNEAKRIAHEKNKEYIIVDGSPGTAKSKGERGEEEKARFLISYLQELHFGNIDVFKAPDNRVPSGFRPNILFTVPGKNTERSLFIISHMDVVPPGDLNTWKSDPSHKNGSKHKASKTKQRQNICKTYYRKSFTVFIIHTPVTYFQ
jgi:ferredoxin